MLELGSNQWPKNFRKRKDKVFSMRGCSDLSGHYTAVIRYKKGWLFRNSFSTSYDKELPTDDDLIAFLDKNMKENDRIFAVVEKGIVKPYADPTYCEGSEDDS